MGGPSCKMQVVWVWPQGAGAARGPEWVQNRSPGYLAAVFVARLYMAIPHIQAMDVTCLCLSSEPPKRNIELFVALKSVSSVEHISCLHV